MTESFWEASRWRRTFGRVLRAEVSHAAGSYGPQYRWTVHPAQTEAVLGGGYCSSLESAQVAVESWVTERLEAALVRDLQLPAPAGEEG